MLILWDGGVGGNYGDVGDGIGPQHCQSGG